jgi:DNA repair protein RadA/Sms
MVSKTKMKKKIALYRCTQCGSEQQYNMLLCPSCKATDSFVLVNDDLLNMERSASKNGTAKRNLKSEVRNIKDIQSKDADRIVTNIGELNRVLGGGFVPGSLVLLGGEPGIGKSTLLMSLALSLSQRLTILYVSGEESEAQIKSRAERIAIAPGELYLVYSTDVDRVVDEYIESVKPDLIIIDSISTMTSAEIGSASGSPTQIKYALELLKDTARTKNVPIVMISHVSKEGVIVGPNTINHDVDTVLYLEGDPFYYYRILRAVKNRFGSTGEVGVFNMEQEGLIEVPNPSAIFLENRARDVPGSTVTIVMEGTRPLATVIEGLTVTNGFGTPTRRATNINRDRAFMIAAVVNKLPYIDLSDQDIYFNVIGGVKVNEPVADLALALTLFSSFHNIPIPVHTVALGEIGLAGEIQSVSSLETRIYEAIALGFKTVVVPNLRSKSAQIKESALKKDARIRIVECQTVEAVLRTVFTQYRFMD